MKKARVHDYGLVQDYPRLPLVAPIIRMLSDLVLAGDEEEEEADAYHQRLSIVCCLSRSWCRFVWEHCRPHSHLQFSAAGLKAVKAKHPGLERFFYTLSFCPSFSFPGKKFVLDAINTFPTFASAIRTLEVTETLLGNLRSFCGVENVTLCDMNPSSQMIGDMVHLTHMRTLSILCESRQCDFRMSSLQCLTQLRELHLFPDRQSQLYERLMVPMPFLRGLWCNLRNVGLSVYGRYRIADYEWMSNLTELHVYGEGHWLKWKIMRSWMQVLKNLKHFELTRELERYYVYSGVNKTTLWDVVPSCMETLMLEEDAVSEGDIMYLSSNFEWTTWPHTHAAFAVNFRMHPNDDNNVKWITSLKELKLDASDPANMTHALRLRNLNRLELRNLTSWPPENVACMSTSLRELCFHATLPAQGQAPKAWRLSVTKVTLIVPSENVLEMCALCTKQFPNATITHLQQDEGD